MLRGMSDVSSSQQESVRGRVCILAEQVQIKEKQKICTIFFLDGKLRQL